MKTTRLAMNALLVSLLLVAQVLNAQATMTEPDDSLRNARPFEVGMYMGANWTLNLIMSAHQPEGITLTVRDAKNMVLHRQHLRKSRLCYHHKIKFEGCEPGVYRIEISDSQQTIVRQVDVVDIPAVAPQRYITYQAQTPQ